MASLLNFPPHTYAPSASSGNSFFPRSAVSVPSFQKFPEKEDLIVTSSSSFSNGDTQFYNNGHNNNFTQFTDPIFFNQSSFHDPIPDPDPWLSSVSSPFTDFPPLFPILPETFNYPISEANFDFVSSVPKRPCLDNGGSGFLPFQNDGFLPLPAPQPFLAPRQAEFCCCEQIPMAESDYREERKAREDKIVSAQSLAARGRRRRITAKTAELGKLIPGGGKMNTAEMLGAAFKYIVFLKTQITVLQFMSSLQQGSEEEEGEMEELWSLMRSSEVQEKLYMEGNCLILKSYVNLLLNHPNPLPSSISDQLKQILS